jgi:hypothetical protein
MSHFKTLILLENPTDIESEVAEALAPFDENTEVPEYFRKCHCIGTVAFNEATEKAGAKFGTLNDLRKSFKNKKDKSDKVWKKHIKPYQEYRDSLIAKHPMKDKPDSACGFYVGDYWEQQAKEGKLDKDKLGQRYEDKLGCGGTGSYISTYNPDSKWDWWVIGGRWQGDLDPDYDYEKDERNWETCDLCNGTGDRKDLTPASWKKECGGCNGCHGKGTKIKWTLAPHEVGNIKLVSEILDYVPFAIVTPDGRWHEKGNMGWWGIVSDEQENWSAIAKRILQEHQSCVAVLCDLHI